MQKKISISLEESLLKNIDNVVNQGTIKKRSQVVEYIIKEYFKDQLVKQVVILAGGKNPKFNRTHFSQNLRMLINRGIEEVYIITNLKDWSWLDIQNIKLKIINEKTPLGTAGALNLVKNNLDSRFFVVLSDIVFSLELPKIIKEHITSNCIATMCITTTEKSKSTDIIILEGNKVKKFAYGVPPKEKSFLTNAGVYLFEKEIFRYIPKKGSLENEVFPKLVEKEKLNSFMFSETWEHNKNG